MTSGGKNMKKIIPAFTVLSLLSLMVVTGLKTNSLTEAKAYTAITSSKLPTTIDLNDAEEDTIRNYYANLNTLTDSEKTGNNLLKNLKPILKNGQKYFKYDGDSLWALYEITDRDWEKSPKEEISGYDVTTNIVTGYKYGSSMSNKGTNPYIHALYVNRDVDNQTKAWDDHQQTQWGINQEHIWPKSHGFENSGEGGARGDPMHLWAGNGRVNGTEHNNYFYGYVDLTKSYTDPVKAKGYTNLSGNYMGTSKTLGSGTVFEPQDSDKGDIARSIFYMVARYNYLSGEDSDGINSNNPNLELVESSDAPNKGYQSTTTSTGKMGILSDLLEWNRIDPVDEYEIHRNNILYNNYTKNRNPFIDFPEWADYIWGDQAGSVAANPQTDLINNEDQVIKLKDFKSSVQMGTPMTFSATVEGADEITWTVQDETVATISKKSVPAEGRIAPKALSSVTVSSGEEVTVTPLKAGKTQLTAKAVIGGTPYEKSYSLVVTDTKGSTDTNENEKDLLTVLLEKIGTKNLILIGIVVVVAVLVIVVLFLVIASKKTKKKVKKSLQKAVKKEVKKTTKKKK